jgi:hypothetical protein
VFNRIIEEYSDNDIWMTYGSFIQINGDDTVKGWAAPADYRTERLKKDVWNVTHLRTFFAGLFRKIQKESLLDPNTNEFYQYSADIAIMLPMLEMAGERSKFLDDINYVHNNINEISEYKVDSCGQLGCALSIRNQNAYSVLEKL